jgi:hypothetical protein
MQLIQQLWIFFFFFFAPSFCRCFFFFFSLHNRSLASVSRMIATIFSLAVLASVALAQDTTTAPATTTAAVTSTPLDGAPTTTTTAATPSGPVLNSKSSVDEWVNYYVAAAKAFAEATKAATSVETGGGDCGGVWSNVSSVLAQTSVKGSRFGSGRTTASCYGFYYGCGAAVKNVTIGDDIYPPDLFVFDDNGNQKAKPPTWEAFATGMCKCKKPLLICLDALNCDPDNNDGKHDVCYAIKKECNRGECPSRGVFCDQDEKCGWNDDAIAKYTEEEKKTILAMRPAPSSASATTLSIAVFAILSIAIAF